MDTLPKDGSLLLSELRDNSVLRSNILPSEVTGIVAIQKCIAALDALCPFQSLTYRHHVGNREFILTNAELLTGEETQITTVGIRDHNGWICTILSDHSPESSAIILRRLYQTHVLKRCA